MPEVIFAGPEGRLEGRYQKGKGDNPPVALILHPHPLFGGTMNNRATYELYQMFVRRGFSTMRFNFRGVAAARANTIRARANSPMRRRRSTICSRSIRMHRSAGSPAFRSAHGLRCSY